MLRLVRWLASLGAVALFLATAWLLFGFAFVCIDTCPDDAVIPGFVTRQLLGSGSQGFLVALALLLPAWVLSLALLARAGETWWVLGVALTPVASGALAVGIELLAGQGELLPTTLAAFNAWDGGLIWAGTALLLWPVTMLVASRRLGARLR
jgi:hypothetical protein